MLKRRLGGSRLGAAIKHRHRGRTARGGRGAVGDDLESRLVWIFGSPRSGTTWLKNLLAEHEVVVPINEPLIGEHLGPFLSDRPAIHAGDLDATSFTLSRLNAERRNYFFAAEFSGVWRPLLGDLIRGRFHAHIAAQGRVPPSQAVVVIKEPNGSQAADMIMQALPRARILFLLRDGRDVVDSELAAHQEGSWMSERTAVVRGVSEKERLDFVVQSAHKWLWRTEAVQTAFRQHRGPKRLVRYEELRAAPASQLREIFDWLELPVEDEALARFVGEHAFERIPDEKRGPERFFRAAQPGHWRENLTGQERTAVEGAIGRKLAELGYDD